MVTRSSLSYRDYAALPDDGRRYELHEGQLSVTPAPGTRHQMISGNLFVLLHQHVRAGNRGRVVSAPVDCILSDSTVVQPDIAYLAADSRTPMSERAIEGPPTLAIEVLSPSTDRIDRGRKMRLYANHGVPYYWVVDGEVRVIDAFRLACGSYAPAARLQGTAAAALPPFTDLRLDPALVWD